MSKASDKKYLRKVGMQIKKLRMNRGLSAENVTLDSGLNMGRIENQGIDLRLTSIIHLCEYYDIPIHQFFKDIGE